MTTEQIEANAERGGSFGNDNSPWETDWGQMARKTVLKRLLNYVPLGKVASEMVRPPSDWREGDAPSGGPREEAGDNASLFDQYMASITTAAPEGIEAVITAIRQDDRLDHEEKTELFNAATARKRELVKRKHAESVA
jgi:hypothetical protein